VVCVNLCRRALNLAVGENTVSIFRNITLAQPVKLSGVLCYSRSGECGFVCCMFQHDPPMMVTDLFEDVKDGIHLLSLLEVLSGETLVSVTQHCNYCHTGMLILI